MNFKATFIPLFAFCILLFTGCASSSPVVATSASVKHPESITIKVTGGTDATSANASQVWRSQFAAELTKSLRQSGLFGKVLTGVEAGADYTLAVALADLQNPEIGASMTANVNATWSLVRGSNGYEIWKK